MGADGYIDIWADDEVRKEFPDCDRLFSYLPTHYTHELDGKKYHHCYSGDNISCSWEDEEDWYLHGRTPSALKRLKEFTVWLKNHKTNWEVWT